MDVEPFFAVIKGRFIKRFKHRRFAKGLIASNVNRMVVLPDGLFQYRRIAANAFGSLIERRSFAHRAGHQFERKVVVFHCSGVREHPHLSVGEVLQGLAQREPGRSFIDEASAFFSEVDVAADITRHSAAVIGDEQNGVHIDDLCSDGACHENAVAGRTVGQNAARIGRTAQRCRIRAKRIFKQGCIGGKAARSQNHGMRSGFEGLTAPANARSTDNMTVLGDEAFSTMPKQNLHIQPARTFKKRHHIVVSGPHRA